MEEKANNRKWDNRYLRLARHVSGWSKDPNAQVGAVLVDAQGRLCAVGYNGFPRQVEDSQERLQDQEMKLDMIIHAEANAITIAGRGAVDGEIFVYGKPVCAQCAGLIIQSGIKRVVAEAPIEGTTSKWDKRGLLAVKILRETNKIDLELLPREELMERALVESRPETSKSPKDAPLFEGLSLPISRKAP
jgi:dCMP deaminase